MKHRLQGDKKTLASDGRMPGLTSEQPRRNPRLQDGFLCVISPPQGTGLWWLGFCGKLSSSFSISFTYNNTSRHRIRNKKLQKVQIFYYIDVCGESLLSVSCIFVADGATFSDAVPILTP
ncbi:MAG: hypothetical protein IJB89_02920 [Akkermansia sp.]|nr:hypothetical protein [Akkermansia sp.]